MRLVILGPPGAGKGTQSSRLSSRLGVPHLSTGEILRSAVSEGGALGRGVESILSSGDLVPDALMVETIADRIGREECRSGFLLDGFPRTIPQAEMLESSLSLSSLSLDAALELTADSEILLSRLAGRSAESSRSDDSPDVIRNRLRVYEEMTAPVSSFYRSRGLLRAVDGMGSIDDVSSAIATALSLA